MRMKAGPSLSVLLLLFVNNVSSSLLSRAEKPVKDQDPECTVTHPVTGEFYDLRPLIRHESDKSD
jgi:hypothetical protein